MNPNDDLDLQRALDALPRSITPPADLWPDIRSRVGARTATPRPRRAAHQWLWPEAFEPRTLRIAAGISIIGIGLTALAAITRANARWTVVAVTGEIPIPSVTGDVVARRPGRRIGGTLVQSPHPFAVGTALTTDAYHHARVKVGGIGHLDVLHNTEVRLAAAQATEHRLVLTRGFIRAQITAPPRLFIVETPSGTAVDLGCEYTLHVDSAGTSTLHVELGWVSFEDHGRESLVPAGFIAINRRGQGLGIPVREDASAPVRWAVSRIEAGDQLDEAVTALQRSAQRWDGVTLWHILPRLDDARRTAVYDLLAELTPPPEGVTREGILRGDRIMLRLYWEQLPLTYPITPSLVRRVWMAWLKVASWF